MLMKWLWESPQIIQGWELMAWGTTHMVREPDPSGEGRGAGHWGQSVTNGWWFIELCLGNEASTEIQKAGLLALESIRVGEQEALRGMWWTREQGRFRSLCTLQIFHWQLICSLDNNWQCEWMFLWVLWVTLVSESNPRSRSWESPVYNPSARSTGGHLTCHWHLKWGWGVGDSLVRMSP